MGFDLVWRLTVGCSFFYCVSAGRHLTALREQVRAFHSHDNRLFVLFAQAFTSQCTFADVGKNSSVDGVNGVGVMLSSNGDYGRVVEFGRVPVATFAEYRCK